MTRSGGMNRIAPAFEWAQSPDSVVLNVKFAHKLDTPATLGCESDTVKMEPKRLVFSAKCPTKRKIFDLKLDLFESIDHEVRHCRMSPLSFPFSLGFFVIYPLLLFFFPSSWVGAGRRRRGAWRVSGGPCSPSGSRKLPCGPASCGLAPAQATCMPGGP